MNDGEDVKICLPEFSEAFDVINHRLLCVKLAALEVPLLGNVGLTATWLITYLRYAS